MEPTAEVWVWAEKTVKNIARVSLELLGKGSELAQHLKGRLVVVLIGNEVTTLAEELIAYGAETVYLVEDPGLELYQSDVYASLMVNLIDEHRPEILLLGATSIGKELAPVIAAKVGTGLTAHCVDLYIEEDDGRPLLVQVVPGWSGNWMLKIVCPQKRPQMATVRPGIMEMPSKDEGKKGEIIRIAPNIKESDFRAEAVELVEEKPAGASLEEAEIVVAGGWGLYSVGGFKPVEELAELLGGVVAGTRPAVDKGWVTEDRMIGQSGKSVSPRLFISLGASGAMHFTTGFLKSKVILAVDQNPEAPIFEVADIGIAGNLGDILPCLLEELKASRLEGAS